MSRALFIDFDGVLHATVGSSGPTRQFVWLPLLLELLVDQSDLGLVVHASAREHSPADFIRDRLGIPLNLWRGVTPPGLERWPSIEAWLACNRDVTDFLILDDQIEEFPASPPPELILCGAGTGISDPSIRARVRDWLQGDGAATVRQR